MVEMESQEITQGGQTMLARLMVSQIWHPPAFSVALRAEGSEKGWWEKAVPHLPPWFQTLQFLPICHRGFSSYYPGSGAKRECVWVSPYVGSLRGTPWNSRSFFHQLNPHWFLQPEVMGIYLPSTGTLGWWRAALGLGLLDPEISLLNFYPTHMDVGPAHSTSLPYLQVWMDVVSLIL